MLAVSIDVKVKGTQVEEQNQRADFSDEKLKELCRNFLPRKRGANE